MILCCERGRAIPIVALGPGAGQAIRSFLARHEIQKPVRIDIHSTGCCDASLFLRVDTASGNDLTHEVDGLTFVISPETHTLVGEVTITCSDENGRQGFVLSSRRPLSEWEGFSHVGIMI
jgi:Fe-S cluster assembly iron-binding protein IscA